MDKDERHEWDGPNAPQKASPRPLGVRVVTSKFFPHFKTCQIVIQRTQLISWMEINNQEEIKLDLLTTQGEMYLKRDDYIRKPKQK
jgi:hypothetical protein